MARRVLITPSILCADLAHLQQEMDDVAGLVDWLQADVMDGHFVPNVSFGAPVVQAIKTTLPLDIHLMVSNPADRIDEFLAIKAANITFHAEAVPKTADRKALIRRIREGKATAGIAINPETPVDAIDDVVKDVDLVLVMSVHPGFGGQEFIHAVLEKIRVIRSDHPRLMIQVDGGVNPKTAKEAVNAGADNLVAGTYLFSSKNRRDAIAALRHA